MAFRKYSKTEPIIFLWFMFPFVGILNALLFGSCVYGSLNIFLYSFGLSAIFIFCCYFIFRTVAILIRKRFPSNADIFRRISAMIPVFAVINILMITSIYAYYKLISFEACPAKQQNFWWAVLFACISSTTIILINEAVVNFQGWKRSITETEQLKNAYQKTKLLGLKGQVNPHFLFNCFNSLSSLISEDEQAAERFLNEMSKVHRYMLRGDDELLVTVEEELRFVQSYLHLIEARFGKAIQAAIEVPEICRNQFIPPLSIHVMLENIIYTNTASAETPLRIKITSESTCTLVINNNIHPRISKDSFDYEEGIDNLLKKYKLLNSPGIEIRETKSDRTIYLPLIKDKEVAF
ncbi:sensor histidine kinase [Flavihumibacter stibioxidans]|uniref:Signal transduction histidine kinase internal region domain-containing protein n=1 Tax=Flavihumibacter stibioxidans TaxID=1834163 RepID=A0ABR7MCE2_9BACT|nr:sensor histidine kinase [Flavihumibacter stibioxidans]MBC6492617.1 hypothetical protein [Flavihumibacter stibioxidans]